MLAGSSFSQGIHVLLGTAPSVRSVNCCGLMSDQKLSVLSLSSKNQNCSAKSDGKKLRRVREREKERAASSIRKSLQLLFNTLLPSHPLTVPARRRDVAANHEWEIGRTVGNRKRFAGD